MTIKERSELAIDVLITHYELREAKNIIKILFEDLFEISNLNSEREFHHEEELKVALKRLENKEPVQYVTGRSNFYGINFKINHNVLIPRPETEELVHWILTDYKNDKRQLDVLDVGTGSGCIALTLKRNHIPFRMFALDNSLDALNVARINSRRLNTPTIFYKLNILQKEYWNELGKFDIIVSNPPYIDHEEKQVMADNVLLYEPEMALFAGDDPLVFYKRIKGFADGHLKQDGRIYLEINEALAAEVIEIFRNDSCEIEVKSDMQGKERMVRVIY